MEWYERILVQWKGGCCTLCVLGWQHCSGAAVFVVLGSAWVDLQVRTNARAKDQVIAALRHRSTHFTARDLICDTDDFTASELRLASQVSGIRLIDLNL